MRKLFVSKYLPLFFFIFGFIIIVILTVYISVNKNPSPRYDYDNYVKQEASDITSDIKTRVHELCSDDASTDQCTYAIKQCNENQSCQNMVTTYQLSKNKTPELNNSAFIDASKEYINLKRSQMGLPILK